MFRGVKPQPAHLKVLRGNPGKRPIPTNEPQPTRGELPAPPDFLAPLAREEWLRVTPELYRLGLLTVVDINPLAAYCQAYSRWVTAERALAKMAEKSPIGAGLVMINPADKKLIQNPLVNIAAHAARDMVRYASEFGLTPVARARLAAGPEKEGKDGWEGLIA